MKFNYTDGWTMSVVFLSDADLFVLPSLDEPFGLVILDAMSTGVPILSTKTQGPLEILSTETAYFLEASNKNEIAKKIELVIKDPSGLRKRLERTKSLTLNIRLKR